MKRVLWILSAIAILLFLFIGSFHLLAYSMFNTNSCTQFNIDNIELRTGINIPEINDVNCENTNTTKRSEFILHAKDLEINDYLKKNNFTYNGEFYENTGESKKTIWDASFYKEDNRLIINLTYKDKVKKH